jgi:DNA-binding Lrp family transcriptional regulator
MGLVPKNLAVSERAVLRLVQSRRATSQVQISRELGLSGTTVHNVVKRLLNQKVVEKASVNRGHKGRTTLHYRLRLPAPLVSIQWLGTEWHGAIINPDPSLDRAACWATENIPDPANAVATIAGKALELLSGAGLSSDEVIGCVISVNAPRMKGGTRMFSSVIPWASELDLGAIESAVGCRTWMV